MKMRNGKVSSSSTATGIEVRQTTCTRSFGTLEAACASNLPQIPRRMVPEGKLSTLLVYGTIALASGTSLGAIAGHPGTSAKGANKSATQVNLTSDPFDGPPPSTSVYASSGTLTTTYNPDDLTLTDNTGASPNSYIQAAPGYTLGNITLQYSSDGRTGNNYETIFGGNSTASFGALPEGDTETGAVQVSWSVIDPDAITTEPDPASGNMTGDITNYIVFGVTPLAQYEEQFGPVPTTISTTPQNGGGGTDGQNNDQGIMPSTDLLTDYDGTDYTMYYGTQISGSNTNDPTTGASSKYRLPSRRHWGS